MRATLLLDAAFALAMGVLYLYVARLVGARQVSSPGARRALRGFVVWWLALAAYTALDGARSLLAAFDVLDREPHAILAYAALAPLVVALWGLVDYLVYIHTGTQRWRRAILVGHVALGAFLFALVVYRHPIGAEALDWDVPVLYERALSGPLYFLAIGAVLGPVLGASAGYLSLAFRVRDPASRARIFTVGGAFFAWFGIAALASATQLAQWYWWPLAADAIALAATLVILGAYRTPRPEAGA